MKTFTLDQHIEELRAELRTTCDAQEAADIKAELLALQDQAILSDRAPEA